MKLQLVADFFSSSLSQLELKFYCWLAGLRQRVAALDSMKKGGQLLLEEELQHLFLSSSLG